MVAIRLEKQRFELAPGQSVLDALLGHDVAIPHACRTGVCQTCLMRAIDGAPPPAAQKDLSPALVLLNYFLACVCHPDQDLTVALPEDSATTIQASVRELRPLNEEIMQVALEAHGPLHYRPGQFLNLFKDPDMGRSYSIASVPGDDSHLHLHVRRLPEGRVSGWIHGELAVGETLTIRGPAGDCFYVPGNAEQPLLLIGTGSGLAPLYGIIRDALRQGHTGPIRLFHGSRDPRGLYLTGELRDLAAAYPQFDYVACVSGTDSPIGHAAGRALDVALTEQADLTGWRVFLCGHPDMVQQAQIRTYLAGAALQNIHADAFHTAAAAGSGHS
jgi:ferredoxin-NADP reductase/ferredoxin